MPETAPVSFDSLVRVTRREARVLAAAGRLTETLDALRPSLEAVIERYVGAPVRLRFSLPRTPGDIVAEAGAGGFEGVVARIRCLEPRAILLLMAPTSLCDLLCSCVLGSGGATPAADRAVSEAVIVHLVADVLRCLPEGLPLLRLDAVTFASGAEVLPDMGRPAVLFVRVRASGYTDLLTLVVPERSLLEWDGGAAPTPPAAALDLRFAARVVCGVGAVDGEALDGLEVGDVLVPDRMVPGTGPAGLAAGTLCDLALDTRHGARFVACVSVHGDRVRVGSSGPLIMEGLMDRDDEHTVVDEVGRVEVRGGDTRRARAADLPAEVIVEAGRASMSVGEILALGPGTVIPLERPVSAEVTLTAAGRRLAHGVLVDMEGELGVQVLKVVR